MALKEKEKGGDPAGGDAWRIKSCSDFIPHPPACPCPLPFPPFPAAWSVPACYSFCRVPLPQQDTNPAGLQRPNKTRTQKYVTVFLSSWHKSKKKKKKKKRKEKKKEKKKKRKKNLLAQGSGVFIFLPAATRYPHRGSPKTSYGLGWRGMSNLSRGLGLSQ